MENENIICTLKDRKNKIIAELKKLDDLIEFYEGKPHHNGKSANGHVISKSETKPPYKRNGNTQKIISRSRELIQEKHRAIPTQEIADTLIAEGFPADYYSRGLTVQIAGYLSRKRDEFTSTSNGWELKQS